MTDSDIEFTELHSLLKQRKFDSVIGMLLDSDGGIAPRYSSNLNHAYYVLADAQYNLDKIDDAKESLILAIDEDPFDTDAYLFLANCYSELENYDESERTLRQALKLKPGDDKIKYNLGNTFFDQKKYEFAIEFYKTISEENSSIYNLAQKNIKNARHELQQRKE